MRNLITTLLRTAPLVHEVATPGGVIKRAKYCVRGLAFARQTQEWFNFLRTPEMAFIVEHNPCLYHKLQRPYLDWTLNTTERLEALKEHYKFILTHFSTALVEEVYVGSGKMLVEMALEKVGTLQLHLSSSKMQKEGDLTVCLTHKESKRRIASMSFSIWKCQAHGKEIYVGGLQGDKATNEDEVVSITRGLYGLRPKALLVYVLQQLAVCWKIHRVRAVSDDLHIYRHFQSQRNVAASYDKFWEECGGARTAEGTFDLPAAFVPRDISTIRVNKRQMYKRRYAMLEGISEQVLAGISGRKVLFVAETVDQSLVAA